MTPLCSTGAHASGLDVAAWLYVGLTVFGFVALLVITYLAKQ